MTTNEPRTQVDLVDALDCNATATARVGTHLTCATHKLEVAKALWNADARLPLFDVDETADLHCGDTYAAPGVSHVDA